MLDQQFRQCNTNTQAGKMSSSDSAAKRAAERRRQRILAKSQARMSVVSGQASINAVLSEESNNKTSEKKVRRRRRQRPSFMTNNLEAEPSVTNSNCDDAAISQSTRNSEKTETEKGNKMPDTTKQSDNKHALSDEVADEADVTVMKRESSSSSSSQPASSTTFSSKFRNRVRRKKAVEGERDVTTNKDDAKNVNNNTSSSSGTSIMDQKRNFSKLLKTEEFCCTWSQVLLSFIIVNVLIVTKLADLQDEQDRAVKVGSKDQEIGTLIYSSMETFPIQRIGFAIIFVRLIIQTIFYILRIRYYPILSVESKDRAGGVASVLQLLDHFRGFFDDMCIFVFSMVVFFIAIKYFGLAGIY
jgi:hypothetical protein